MALATFVKISSVNNLSDARYCAGMEVDQLGFVIEEGNESYVSPTDFKELSDWISGVEFVGEIYDSNSDIKELSQKYSLDAIQVQHRSQLTEALDSGLKTIFYTEEQQAAKEVLAAYPDVDYVLWHNIETDDLTGFEQSEKLVIGAGFNADNVKTLTADLHLKGISMQGGKEIRPGYKNFDELADILEALDTDEFV